MKIASCLVLLGGALLGASCATSAKPRNGDSAFAALQTRGASVMGVDQYTSAHVFEDLPDGGRIVLVRQDSTDSAGVATIRAHMRSIADAFAKGDFSAPGMVHMQQVPGTDVMAARRSAIRYSVADRAGGGEVRLTSSDADVVKAIHEFLAFQRMDHRAGGHVM